MKIIITLLASSLVTLAAHAGPECTKEDKSKWKNDKEFQKSLVDQGYKIKVFKTTKGNCYEIYGWNKEGKKVEIYFHPVTGEIVKQEIN